METAIDEKEVKHKQDELSVSRETAIELLHLERLKKKILATTETARRSLIEAGMLDNSGKLHKNYR